MGSSRMLQGSAVCGLALLLSGGLAVSANAQNILINEVNRNAGAVSAAGDEWVEVVLAEPLTAAQLNEYVVGDSSGARAVKFGGYQFTSMESIAANFPAGTIIVIAGGAAGLTEDLAYNPGSNDWNLTFVVGQPTSDTHLTNVGAGSMDFAGDDVAYVDVTPEGLLTGEGFGIAWRGPGGPFGESVQVSIADSPLNSGDTTLATLGDDYTSTLDFFWLFATAPTPGQANDGDSNGVWINNLRAGIPSSDPLIRVGVTTLDFGTVQDNVFPLPTLEFQIRNSALASNTLVVSSLTVSPNDNNFRVVPPTPDTPINIAPGASATVTVEFDPLGTPGLYDATLAIAHNDSNGDKGDIVLALTGQALSSSVPAAFTGTLPAVYEEDFDALPNLEQFETQEQGDFAVPYPWNDNATVASWYASQTLNPPTAGIFASTGTDSNPFNAMSSGLYSFGEDGVAERALGSVAGSSTGTLYYGLRLLNDTGVTIPSIQVEYVGEQWRLANNTTAHKLEFSYAISDDPFLIAPILNDGFIAVPTLDFISPQVGAEASPLDGNDPANQVVFDVTIQGVDLLPGQEIFLRWFDINDGGVDHGLALDDVRITALPPTVPTINFEGELLAFVTEVNTPSAVQSYGVTGENLTGDVSITPPEGFQVSLASNGPWTSNPSALVIPVVGETLALTTVYVRALSAATGPISGNIVHATPEAGDQVVAVSASIQPGPLVLSAVDVAVTENLDSLGTAVAAPLPLGFAFVGGSLEPIDYTFATTRAAGNTGTGVLTGTSAAGYYNFAEGETATATDRAVGFLTSGSFSSPRNLLLTMLNDTGNQITQLAVEFDVEKYRSGSRDFDFNFHYSTNGIDWTQVPEASVNFPTDGANNIIFAPALSFPQTATITELAVNPGSRVYLRWEYAGVGGSSNGQGLSVDNISITPSGVPVEPNELGDVNGDGTINVADVTELANLVEAGNPPAAAVGDINGDTFVNEADVAALAEAIVDGTPLD